MQYIKTVTGSFYSPEVYSDLAYASEGVGWPLVFIQALIATIAVSLILCFSFLGTSGLSSFIGELPEITQKLPAIQIENGKLSMDKPSPYYLKIGTAPHDATIVMDTNYQSQNIDALESYMKINRVPVIITSTQFITLNRDKLEAYSLDRITQKVTITHEKWDSYGNTVHKWGVTMIIVFTLLTLWLFMLPGLTIAFFVLTFFSAIATKILSVISRAGLNFSACMRVAAAFRIPVIVLGQVFALVHTSMWVGWAIWGGYLVFSMWSVKRSS